MGLHVEATSGTPLLLLRERESPFRVVPIFIGELEAASIAIALSGQTPPRPLAHDLMATLVNRLDVHVDSVEVTDMVDGAFIATLNLSGPTGGHHLDTRPSDAIALAVRVGAPLFVRDTVLDEAGAIIEESEDEGVIGDKLSIDESVAEFRSFLDAVDPDDFTLP
ncbi:MAG TPA: bifunctional nuclease family protein [Acidimicrobiales bacterium]|nr:bifunctional nuclease family protein [Acidimicrobiales bacterium]